MDEKRIVERIRKLYAADAKAGRARPLAAYLRMFSGYEELVRREIEALERPTRDARLRHAKTDTSEATTRIEPPAGLAAHGTPAAAGGGVRTRDAADGLAELLASLRGARYGELGEIARGGMGAIHRVRDAVLARELAMKVLLDDPATTLPETTLRFVDEAKVTAQLDHPGVVPVHELGLDAKGRVFFTMRLVTGRTMGQVFALVAAGDPDWSQTRAIGILARVCETLAFAHSRGVIHRDVKPANVMVGEFGEVYVMDWGLAKVLGAPALATQPAAREGTQAATAAVAPAAAPVPAVHTPVTPRSDAHHTLHGSILGTPGYISPEQAQGDLDRLDARTDVYAVGAMLYELLAGSAPYADAEGRGAGSDSVAAERAGPPTPLRRRAPGAPEELVAICETAMARAAPDRYADAALLGRDLQAFLEGRVVRAHRTGPFVELFKWMRRNRALAAAVGAAFVLLVAGLASNLTLLSESRRETMRARRQLYRANLTGAATAIRENDMGALRSRLADLGDGAGTWEARVLAACVDESAAVVPAHAAWFDATSRLLLVRPDGVLVRRDGPGAAVSVLLDVRPRRVLSVSQDGRWAVVSREQGSRESWHARDVVSVAGGRTVLDFGELHVTVGFHRRRPWAYWASSEDPRLRLFDLEAKKELAVREGPDPRMPVAFEAELADGDAAHPDGLVAATCGTEGKDTWVGDAATLRTLAVISGHSEFSQFRFSRATGRLFTASLDDTVACWDLARPGEPLWRIPAGDIIDPLGLAVSPRGETLAVAPIDGTLRLLDGATGRPRAILRGAARSMSLMGADPRRTVIDYAPDGSRVLTLQDDATVLLWDPEAHDAPTTLRGHAGFVYDVEFSPDGALLASCGWDGFVGKPGGVRLWDPRTGDAVASFGSDTEFFSRVAWSADGRRLYACARSMRGEPPRVLCVDRDTGRRLESPALLDWNLSFDPSRTRAVVCEPLEPWTPTVAPGKQLRAVRVLDLATGVAGARGPTTRDSDLEVRFLGPDLIAYDGGDGAVAVADAATLLPKLLLRGHTARPWSVARSPDGALIATGASDGSVRLWDARTGAPTAVLPGHGSTALGIEFSRDGRLVVVGGQDGHVHLWDAEHFEEIASLPGHTNYVKDVAFSPDGATLASASGDGTVRIWSAEPLAARLAARRERAELAARLRPRIEALLLRKGVFEETASAAAAELRADASLAPRAREVALQTLLAEAVARRAR